MSKCYDLGADVQTQFKQLACCLWTGTSYATWVPVIRSFSFLDAYDRIPARMTEPQQVSPTGE